MEWCVGNAEGRMTRSRSDAHLVLHSLRLQGALSLLRHPDGSELCGVFVFVFVFVFCILYFVFCILYLYLYCNRCCCHAVLPSRWAAAVRRCTGWWRSKRLPHSRPRHSGASSASSRSARRAPGSCATVGSAFSPCPRTTLGQSLAASSSRARV